MKQNVALNVVETNMTGQRNFSIKNSAKAFKILSSGIYKDKIKAIVREVSCNAYDSHVAAGKADVPFDVHLPSYIEPYFAVRDYGTGMTDAQIKKLYTTYFDSTKEDSNDFIGALGIGSKSPFSYTDNYTVTAWDGSHKRVYSCYIGEDGTPAIVSMGKEQSTEATGIEVRLAVKDIDAKTFTLKAKEIFYWFETKPNGVPIEATFKTDPLANHFPPHTYITLKDVGRNYNTSCDVNVRMGQVHYPIDFTKSLDKVKHNFTYKTYKFDYSFESLRQSGVFTDKGITFNVGIGDVDMTASREDLEYTRHTDICLEKLVFGYVDGIIKFLIDGVESAKTYEEAHFIYQANSILNKTDVLWQGMSLQNNKRLRKILVSPYIRVFDLEDSRNSKPIRYDGYNGAFSMRRRVFVVIKDKMVPYLWEKMQQYYLDNENTIFNTNSSKDYCIFTNGMNNHKYKMLYLHIDSKRMYSVIENMLKVSKIPYIKASEVPDLHNKPVKSAVNTYETAYYNVADYFNSIGYNGTKSCARSRRVISPSTDTGWYYEYSTSHNEMMKNMPIFQALKEAGYLGKAANGVQTDRIYVLPQRLISELKNNPNWHSIKDSLTTFKDQYINDCRTIWKTNLSDFLSYTSLVNLGHSGKFVRYITTISPEFKKLSDKFFNKDVSRLEIQAKLDLWYELTNDEKIPHIDFKPKVEKFIADNPVLRIITGKYRTEKDDMDIALHYVPKGVLK